MKQVIKNLICKAVAKLYPDYKDIDFSVDYAPAGIDADFASNVALILAKKMGKKPMDVASVILNEVKNLDSSVIVFPQNDKINIEAAPPGFLNFKFSPAIWQKELAQILKLGIEYGFSHLGAGKKINVEFVSANPTGPLTVGHGRGAVIGLVLSNILKTSGYKVVRDYYYNDAGLQIKKLGESVRLQVRKLLGENTADEFHPEQIDIYLGAYIKDIATQFIEQKNLQTADNATIEEYSKFAAEIIFGWIKNTLDKLGVSFDNFIKESDQKTKKILEQLEKAGIVYEKAGAKWLENIKEREDKVLMRKTGEPTYRLPDIAYHLEKVKKYDKAITILGADHIGQFPDISYAVGKLGGDSGKIAVITNQFVTLAGGKKMSTRKANYVTLDELIQEVGPDVTKFFMLMSASSSHMNFDLELARDTSEKNPVYRVQYAHARINSIVKKIKNQKSKIKITNQNLKLLENPEEVGLIRELAKFPELVYEIASNYTVHRLPHYLLGLSDKFHSFYEKVRVITEDVALTAARLSLVEGVRIVLANGLRLMGIKPMEKM